MKVNGNNTFFVQILLEGFFGLFLRNRGIFQIPTFSNASLACPHMNILTSCGMIGKGGGQVARANARAVGAVVALALAR